MWCHVQTKLHHNDDHDSDHGAIVVITFQCWTVTMELACNWVTLEEECSWWTQVHPELWHALQIKLYHNCGYVVPIQICVVTSQRRVYHKLSKPDVTHSLSHICVSYLRCLYILLIRNVRKRFSWAFFISFSQYHFSN